MSGRGRGKGARFTQSLADFPLTVSLGEKSPTWGLSRWDGDGGLSFRPTDDEGYSIRGGRDRLVYKGRRRSHRFTILNDGAFEYDCVLLREPESNVVSLKMDGAGNFDFLRQPDFIKDPLWAGSYAVYKKETLIGEGTGKLCHIHRPEIIDAGGRRCWGGLSIVGDRLDIIVPEKFLGEAAYPVTVDPVIGTTTVGRQDHYIDLDGYFVELFFEMLVGVNRFLVPETFNGPATAFVYAYNTDFYGRCQPVLYSDNRAFPHLRRSASEGLFNIQVRNNNPAGWRSTTFRPNTPIQGGSHVWFGLFCDFFAPRFDFGAVCYRNTWDFITTDIPNVYPVSWPNVPFDLRLSMYFTYTVPRNHVRTIFQGVTLNDRRRGNAGYRRTPIERVRLTTGIRRFGGLHRRFVEAVRVVDRVSFSRTMRRIMREIVRVANTRVGRFLSLPRRVAEAVRVADLVSFSRSITRLISETVRVINTRVGRFLSLPRRVAEAVWVTDGVTFFRSLIRSLREAVGIVESGVDRIKGLFRKVDDNVAAHDGVLFLRFLACFVYEIVGIVETKIDRLQSLFRKVDDKAAVNDDGFFSLSMFRRLNATAKIVEEKTYRFLMMPRRVYDIMHNIDNHCSSLFVVHFVKETVKIVESNIDRFLTVCMKIIDNVRGLDKTAFPLSMVRFMRETARIGDVAKGSSAFFRRMLNISNAASGIRREGLYARRLTAHVGARGYPSRKLSVVVRLFSGAAALDTLVGRLFMPRGELVLKSKIVGTLVLDSKIK